METKDLNVYIFVGNLLQKAFPIDHVRAIGSENLEKAMKGLMENPTRPNVFYQFCGSFPLDHLLPPKKTEEKIVVDEKKPVVAAVDPKIAFLANLKYVVDILVTDSKESKSLTKIIQSLEKQYGKDTRVESGTNGGSLNGHSNAAKKDRRVVSRKSSRVSAQNRTNSR